MAYRPTQSKSFSGSVEVKMSRYLHVCAGMMIVFVSTLVLRMFSGEVLRGVGLYYADPLLLLLIVHFLCSWREVPVNYIGGITAFNQPAWEIGSGWYYVPFGFCTLGIFPMSEQQEQFPSDPEKISKRPDTSLLGKDEFRPIRLNTGPGTGVAGDILGAERSAPEVTFSVRWQPRSKSFFELLMNVPGDTWADKHHSVRRAMRDTGEGLLTREAAKRSGSALVQEIGQIGDSLRASIQEAFKSYDISINDVQLQSPDFGDGVNHALSEVLQTAAKARETDLLAKAEQGRLIDVAEGDRVARLKGAEARTAELAAEGEGRKLAADALNMRGEDYMALQQAPQILGDKTIIVGTDGIAQAVGLGKSVLDQIKKSGDEKK